MSRRVLFAIVFALSTADGALSPHARAVPLPARATASAPAPPDYTTRAVHDPNGIGKFYMGREIAKVMGYESAKWLERAQRERQEQGARLLASLKIRPGDVVADIGAGSGYYTFRLARLVGPGGRVKAVDIQPEMLDLIRKRQSRQGFRDIDLVLGRADDPNLPPESVDLVLMVDVYHEFEWPFEMMQHIVRALKPGGRVAFVEFKQEDPRIPIKPVHKMSEAQVLLEMQPFGLIHQETVRNLPWQHVIIFEKPLPASQPAS
jgi:ubiquinone/menaquinone biosynthesis C-methylase UbiE